MPPPIPVILAEYDKEWIGTAEALSDGLTKLGPLLSFRELGLL